MHTDVDVLGVRISSQACVIEVAVFYPGTLAKVQ